VSEQLTAGRTGWSLRRRVNLGLIGVLALLMVLIAVVTLALVGAKRTGDEVVNRWDPAFLISQNSLAAMVNQETGLRGFALGRDDAFLEPYDLYAFLQGNADSTLRRYLNGHDDLLELHDEFRDAVDSWRSEVAEPIIAAVRAGDPTALETVASAEAKAAFDRIRDASSRLTDGIDAKRLDEQEARSAAFTLVFIALGATAVLLVTTGGLLWAGLRRSVLAPIGGLVAQTRQVAAGALDKEIVQRGPAEIESLAEDVDLMRERLAAQIARIERARLRLQQRSAELARSNADLEQFAYVASHDLSEPLRKVTNFCQLLERQYADELDDKARQYIAFMVDGAKRMQLLINDLLAFSRVGRTTEHFVPVDLDQALSRALSNLEDQITAAGAQVVHGPLPTVQGDPTLLAALLQNLIGNAVKYRSIDRRAKVEITAERDGEIWLFTVTDNGIGIDRQYAERIFTIFQRLHLRDEYGGTGIGLALCRKIVDFHKGRIWLTENKEPGARFQFTLPERQAVMETDDEPEARPHP
jgi:signal transduction histidine kinase